MSRDLQSQQGVTTWRAIPDDFVLEIRLNESGCPYTSAFSLTPDAQVAMSGLNIHTWLERAGKELIELFHAHTKIDRGHLRVCSNACPLENGISGRWDIWIVSLVPLPRTAIGGEARKSLYDAQIGNVRRTTVHDLDVEAYVVNDINNTIECQKVLKSLSPASNNDVIDI